mmetsp:Transcript_40586/g.55247  ORF Transcript_40586/g.55247 Transcript_40586/m.55247 type:complete len:530 (-) Transcript_40586:849-2438(-)
MSPTVIKLDECEPSLINCTSELESIKAQYSSELVFMRREFDRLAKELKPVSAVESDSSARFSRLVYFLKHLTATEDKLDELEKIIASGTSAEGWRPILHRLRDLRFHIENSLMPIKERLEAKLYPDTSGGRMHVNVPGSDALRSEAQQAVVTRVEVEQDKFTIVKEEKPETNATTLTAWPDETLKQRSFSALPVGAISLFGNPRPHAIPDVRNVVPKVESNLDVGATPAATPVLTAPLPCKRILSSASPTHSSPSPNCAAAVYSSAEFHDCEVESGDIRGSQEPCKCDEKRSRKRSRMMSNSASSSKSSPVVPSKRKQVTYQCSACSETYATTSDLNPWWALSRQSCPKCHRLQIPRIDISEPANAIEYHPALIRSATNMAVEENENNDSGAESGDESDAALNDVVDDAAFQLSPVQASKLLVLITHARTCPGHHRSARHREVCQSVKYLMLHIRDCCGKTNDGRDCAFPWCKPCKCLLMHLVKCHTPEKCSICSPWDLPPSLRKLKALNHEEVLVKCLTSTPLVGTTS